MAGVWDVSLTVNFLYGLSIRCVWKPQERKSRCLIEIREWFLSQFIYADNTVQMTELAE